MAFKDPEKEGVPGAGPHPPGRLEVRDPRVLQLVPAVSSGDVTLPPAGNCGRWIAVFSRATLASAILPMNDVFSNRYLVQMEILQSSDRPSV